ncbi:hypothetical protein Lesp02_48440 [Lentzea sp. NBRC 105346]|uniref:alcohol dehydrogenase catalytic domain-containing protein n=1 Tax=Lentzea sp. NBRC 105346 TaxID=3032205 RepID=UPI0024A0C1AC|nr:alcohol dehydrogenase catalytic domain-containing protein [Lentzea sp. NBRC 105346]GLZ32656.1 hypothetical protein Lesp02_48440 [Lentzea sp. NBRC 105346]
MWAIAAEQFGGPVRSMELPEPAAGPGELKVRMFAAGVNPFDRKVVDGMMRDSMPHVFPLVPGTDGAGEVVETGERIFGTFFHSPVGVGTFAEYTTVPATNALAPLPDELDPVVAAALPTSGMTALQLSDRLEGADSVLVVGARGGVGSFLTQLLGDRAIPIGRGDALVEADALVDLVSDADRYAANRKFARSLAFTTNYAAAEKAENFGMKGSLEALTRLAGLVLDGTLQVPITRRLPLREANDVFAGSGGGKTVVVM